MKRLVLRLLQWVSLIYAGGQAVAVLVRHRDRLRLARRILLYPEGGFGHTLSGPDWLRRLYPDDDWVVLFGYNPGRHNPVIAELWGQRRFLWIAISPDYPKIRGLVDPGLTQRLFAVLGRVLAWVNPGADILDVYEMRRRSPVDSWVDPADAFGRTLEAGFLPLVVRHPAPALHLGADRLGAVDSHLRRLGGTFQRRCTLFVRAKGIGSADLSNVRRCGAALDDHLPAIRWLVQRGYQVFLTGEHRLDATLIAEFGPAVLDAGRLPLDPHLYLTYSGCETDLLIGNMAGGSAFAHANGLPTLILDAFPFSWCIARTTVHYKTLRDLSGALIGPAETLTRYAIDFTCADAVLCANDADQILAAVSDFAQGAGVGTVHGLSERDLGLNLPVLRSGDARISPAWLKIFEPLGGTSDIVAAAADGRPRQ